MKKIEKLQFQLEELMYEKDKIAYQWANAQKVHTYFIHTYMRTRNVLHVLLFIVGTRQVDAHVAASLSPAVGGTRGYPKGGERVLSKEEGQRSDLEILYVHVHGVQMQENTGLAARSLRCCIRSKCEA